MYPDVVAFYAVQLHLLLRWSGGRAALIRRGLLTGAVSVVAFVATTALIPGITIRQGPAVVLAALVLATLTTLLRPVLIGLLSPFSVVLVAAATILVQGLAFLVLARLPIGLGVDGPEAALLGALVFAVATAILTAGLSIGDDSSFFGTLVRQLAARHRHAARSDRPGVVFIQIDGLGRSVLEDQLRAGRAPNLARWVRSKDMTIDTWEPLLPSQTSASQAGILHGNNDGIPAFRWWEKRGQRLLVSNHPADAREIMRRVSNGDGLLANGGASIGNLLSGDATRSYLTAATLDDPARELRRSHVLDWFFISPYSYVRWIVLSIGEVVKELVQARRARRGKVDPPGDRRFPYPLARAATNVLLRHLTTALVIEEMYRGAPAIYADFVDYDEIAHHSGPERVEARDALEGLDRIVGLVEKAALDAPRPSRFVVLSDHGQSPGATFRQRNGTTLEGLVAKLAGGKASVRAATGHIEHLGRMGSLLSEGSRMRGLGARLTSGAARQRAGAGDAALPDVVVAASGNLAHISFPRLPGRATRETIDAAYPGLIDGLVRHEGVGLVLVRSASGGPLVLGTAGVSHLAEDRVDGDDPIAAYGPNAAAGLARLDAMTDCGDVVVISMFDPASGEVAAFEEQIGSHGGLGGAQTHAFVLHPTEWRVYGSLVGAPALHRQIRRWLTAQEREDGETSGVAARKTSGGIPPP
jgi:uncharacterized membrane protein YvlD (DUF360 family)